MDWREKVYHPTESDMDEDWEFVSLTVKRIDGFICQRCHKVRGKDKLSCHHIIPRADGGQTIVSNLVTLCSPCHDEVEELELRSRFEIKQVDYTDQVILLENEPEYDVSRPSWHTFVYGGAKNPDL